MPKLSSLEDLQALRDRILNDYEPDKPRIVISAGSCGLASGADDVQRLVKRYLLEKGLLDRVSLRIIGCIGFCEMGPSILAQPMGAFYPKVQADDIPRIIDATLEKTVVEELLYKDPITSEICRSQGDISFFKKQKRTVMGRNQELDPIRMYNYLAAGGYKGLARAVEQNDAAWIVDEVKTSKLRGRGGAGFPTGVKWELAARQDNKRGKYVVCNADEGDPGAYMDRAILEGNPHSVIEGMIIGGLAMGATEGVIFVRYEYPLAIKHSIIALRVAREYGLLGEDILGTGFNFDINVVQSAGAFVCGEETALIRTIEGYMGEPRQRPPYPIERGIHGLPTCINNVETWANVPQIVEHGGAEYAKVGTDRSTGTKVFSLVGKIRNTGLVEVPMGISIKEIIHDIGGGPVDGATIKAVQIGGPSGGCIPAHKFDLPIDYDSLTEAGAIMGSGGMIVMDDNTCMPDVAKYFMNFLRDESCGKCFICRKGTQRMYEILDDITSGRGTMEQLDLLEELAHVVRDTSMCGLGQSAPNPVLSTLRYYREEYERHIVDKRCDAHVCKELVGAPCQATCPIGTEAWRYVAHISRGEYDEAYRAIREQNPFPSVCARVCDHKCESQCRLGQSGADPVAIRALKRFVTDRTDPSVFQPEMAPLNGDKVAVVGSGPAGLTVAHYMSLMGYKVTVLEADNKPGGMLVSGVPTYRLPREVMEKEIDAICNERITIKCSTAVGRDVSVDQLMEEHQAVFLAPGAHRSRRLRIEGEDGAGVFPSMRYLKHWNLKGENLAKGKVGVIGGGNSAIDAARVALRQEGVESVTILYRRTRQEMPAFEPEIRDALKEGIKLETLISPVKIHAESGQLTGVEFIKNELGKLDASGRRRPVPVKGSEYKIPLDTLIVAIGEQMQAFDLEGAASGVELTTWSTVKVNEHTLATSRAGVFSGGDAVTGPNTVVDAIAAGKKAAVMIDRYIRGEELRQAAEVTLPDVYVAPRGMSEEEAGKVARADCPTVSAGDRRTSFVEVESALRQEDAVREARRCLRCDLEFTMPKEDEEPLKEAGGQA